MIERERKRKRKRERERERGEKENESQQARLREKKSISEGGLEGSFGHATVTFSRRSQAGTQAHWQNSDHDSLRPGWLGIAPVKTA